MDQTREKTSEFEKALQETNIITSKPHMLSASRKQMQPIGPQQTEKRLTSNILSSSQTSFRISSKVSKTKAQTTATTKTNSASLQNASMT